MRHPIGISRQPTVSSEYLRLFASAAQGRGLDVSPILTASGIDRSILDRRGARVGAGAAEEAWKRVIERLDDPLFGLTMNETIPRGVVGLLDYVVMTSDDIGEGLGRLSRYAPLMGDAEQLTLVMQGNEAHFRFYDSNEVPYPIEMIMGLFARKARDQFGRSWSLKRVCFTHAPLGPRAVYERVCQAQVLFEMPFTEAVFARDLTEMEMPGADPRLNAILTPEAETALATVTPPAPPPSFVDSVKLALADGVHERDLTLNRLADNLGLSTRTLQRRLRAAGVTHRQLVRDVRQDLAQQSLATGVTQGRIARNLGYSGTGAFQRAFKRWSGMTPGHVRRAR
jgi:AraC-like DNA-binding protein